MKAKNSSEVKLNSRIALAVKRTCEAGLITGPGELENGKFVPGDMCVEQVISHVLGFDHENDKPRCVGEMVGKVKMALNDTTTWESEESRGMGLAKVAVAQLGSNTIDQEEFLDSFFRFAKIDRDDDYDRDAADLIEDYLEDDDNWGGEKGVRFLVDCALKALIELKSPGCRYLYLFQEEPVFA